MIIGAQMYGVREYTKTLEGFSEALQKIAAIGYTCVQVSGTCAYEGTWLAAELKKAGLTCGLTHYGFDEMVKDPVAVVQKHKTFGCRYIGVGAMPGIFNENTQACWRAFAEKALPVAKAFRENGAYLMYHNHAKEFEDVGGACAWDYLKNTFAPELMGFTADTHWVDAGSRDVVETLVGVRDRIPCVHLKDTVFTPEGERRFAPVGSGVLPFRSILDTCLAAGVEYAFVEQDNCYGEDPFACLKQSFDYLRAEGLC